MAQITLKNFPKNFLKILKITFIYDGISQSIEFLASTKANRSNSNKEVISLAHFNYSNENREFTLAHPPEELENEYEFDKIDFL